MFSKFKFKKGIALVLFSLTLIGGVFNTNIQGVNAQEHEDFTTLETASYFNDAFDYLDAYELSDADLEQNGFFEALYGGDSYIYVGFPIYYDIAFSLHDLDFYYSNEYFNFYLNQDLNGMENDFFFNIKNYVGTEDMVYFGRLNSSAMATYISNEKTTNLSGGIILIIVSVVSGLLGGLGKGIGVLFVDLFTNGTGRLSSVAIWVIVLLGVSIALGAIAWVATLIRGKQR